MTRESSPSKGWQGTAEDMDAEEGAGGGAADDLTPEELRDLADTVRSEGFDRVAEWIEECAEEVGA